MEFTVPDTLVLKIVEHETGRHRDDTRLYILYDKNKHRFVIRGKRYDGKIPSCSYSFDCEFAHELADFIEFLIDDSNTVSYILYNYDKLYWVREENHEILKDCLNKAYDDSLDTNKITKEHPTKSSTTTIEDKTHIYDARYQTAQLAKIFTEVNS